MAFYQFHSEQKINASINEIWDFISSPTNLKEITPDYMGFDIINTKQPLEKMYDGMIIGYKVSPIFGIKTTWVTEITHIRDKEFFIDEQRIGPYAMWHHQHLIRPIENGVLMTDIVSYQPPFGVIGAIANKLVIQSKLKKIFNYRTAALEKRFGIYSVK
ncbi:MAG: SRPBCC family protein [Paludibacter sp.]|nr:SRPBCC family protein [Paludibacter sp.]